MPETESQPQMKRCRACAELILAEAEKCKHCGVWQKSAASIGGDVLLTLKQRVAPVAKKALRVLWLVPGIALLALGAALPFFPTPRDSRATVESYQRLAAITPPEGKRLICGFDGKFVARCEYVGEATIKSRLAPPCTGGTPLQMISSGCNFSGDGLEWKVPTQAQFAMLVANTERAGAENCRDYYIGAAASALVGLLILAGGYRRARTRKESV